MKNTVAVQKMIFPKSTSPIQTGSVVILLFLSGCALLRSDEQPAKPISNPFFNYHPNSRSEISPMVLRTKKGDRSVELELPGDTENLSDFVLPVSPAFKDSSRNLANLPNTDDYNAPTGTDETYKNKLATPSDQEITRSFSHGSIEDENKRRSIEQSLNLVPSEDDTPTPGTLSYLAKIDHIKQLYRATRFEAALLETDDMIKTYQTDPQLHEMRGTLLDRLGRREMALKSWNQALKLNPQNQSLRKFLNKKQSHSTVGLP